MRHVFRNALIPIATIAALNFGALLGGAIITETVFSLDGIGYYFIQKLTNLDLYAVMAYLLDHRGRDHPLQPDRRHPVRLSRPAHPL